MAEAPNAVDSRTTDPSRPRAEPPSPRLLARVFHQPALLYFNAVAEHLSMREAARRLQIASSAVTRQVTYLEDALGLDLFIREERGLTLTPAGEILYRHTRGLMAPFEAAMSELDLLRGLKTGTVRIAAVESIGLTLLPELIAGFGARYPRLDLGISIAGSDEVVARVADGRADIGFAFLARPTPEVEIALRRDVPIGAVMVPDHPLAAAARITLADCTAFPFAVAAPGISIRTVIDPFLRRALASRQPYVEVNAIRLLVTLAATGGYVSIMTPIGVQRELAQGALVFRPLQDAGLPRNRFGLIVKASGVPRFAPAAFYETAKAQLETMLPEGLP